MTPLQRAREELLAHARHRLEVTYVAIENIKIEIERLEAAEFTSSGEVLRRLSASQRRFIETVLGVLGRGLSLDEAAIEGTKQTYPQITSTSEASKKAEQLMAAPGISPIVEQLFAEHDFTRDDAVSLHVKHILGKITKQVVTKTGVVEVSVPPSLSALLAYEKHIFPSPVSRAVIARVDLGGNGRGEGGDEPEMTMRPVGAANLEALTIDGNGTVESDDDDESDDEDS